MVLVCGSLLSMCYKRIAKRALLVIGMAFAFLLVSAAVSNAHENHTVKSGDTLSGIGDKYDVSWQKIWNENKKKVPDPDLIYPGQRLSVPVHDTKSNNSSASLSPPPKKNSSSSSSEKRPISRSSSRSQSASPVDCGLRLTQHYGNPGSYTNGYHTGVDFGSCGSDNIQAVRGGEVVKAGWDGAWGNIVIVQHGKRYSWYAHMSSISVGVGNDVSAGQKLGKMGNTGNSSGKHLHYSESVGGYRYSNQVRPELLPVKGY